MYTQRYVRRKGLKKYYSLYIAESYRKDGKVKRRHLANLSKLPVELQDQICDLVRKFKDNNISLEHLNSIQGKSCGALIAFQILAKRMGIIKALGNDKQGKLALIQIISRIVSQQSRNFTANEWVDTQAIEEVIGLDSVSKDDLYKNLDWLAANQDRIEDSLFSFRHSNKELSSLYLYDVTSSYFEGSQNELSAFGYNRDKKKGKRQIVIGLLCDAYGYPISIEVFKGNTSDTSTVYSQIQKLANRFKVKNVVLVGDRGMIKRSSIEKINELKWNYITAITKSQINKMLDAKVFDMDLFTEELIEIEDEGIRYIMHRNPLRAQEIAKNREEKKQKLVMLANDLNEYLKDHPRADANKALAKLNGKINKLKTHTWLEAHLFDRHLKLEENEEKLREEQKLDGCYVIKSNVSKEELGKKEVHDRYKDLSMVEQAFRTCKQSIEEIRPIYVRKSSRTIGHVFVCMLAYILIKKMWELCSNLNMSRKCIIEELNQLQYTEYRDQYLSIKVLPRTLNSKLKLILTCLDVKLPSYL